MYTPPYRIPLNLAVVVTHTCTMGAFILPKYLKGHSVVMSRWSIFSLFLTVSLHSIYLNCRHRSYQPFISTEPRGRRWIGWRLSGLLFRPFSIVFGVKISGTTDKSLLTVNKLTVSTIWCLIERITNKIKCLYRHLRLEVHLRYYGYTYPCYVSTYWCSVELIITLSVKSRTVKSLTKSCGFS